MSDQEYEKTQEEQEKDYSNWKANNLDSLREEYCSDNDDFERFCKEQFWESD